MKPSSLKDLRGLLVAAKEAEAQAKAYREQVEIAIYNAFAARQVIPEKGVVRADGIKMTMTQSESWNGDMLTLLSREIPAELFPFKASWKCDTRARNKLATSHPDVYRKLFPALTIKQAKPSFEVEDLTADAAPAPADSQPSQP